jgi:hypothetical protein
MTMSKMFIRVKTDGFIYPYNEIMAKNPLCEVVPEEIAYPERFMPPKAAKRKSKLDLTTEDIPEEVVYTSPELAAEAAKGMPK